METIHLDADIPVFYITATSFPAGIREATDQLHERVPFSADRKYFGLSRPENGGDIVYRAAAEEMYAGEGLRLNCGTLTIPKGKYISIVVNDFRKDILSIDRAFKELLQYDGLDPQGYCVEWYANDREAVTCMIRLEQ